MTTYYQTIRSTFNLVTMEGIDRDASKPRYTLVFDDDFKHFDSYYHGYKYLEHKEITLSMYLEFGRYIAKGELSTDIKKAQF